MTKVLISDTMDNIAEKILKINNIQVDVITDLNSNQLNEIIIENEVNKLVVGIPYNMKGEDTPQTLKVKEFVSFLESELSFDIILIDERLSSVEAEKTMHKMNIKTGHNKSDIDKIAASVILQEYLDSNHG